MEIRVIKRDQVIENEAVRDEISLEASKQEPEKSFAQSIEKLIRDVRKKNDAEKELNFETVFNTRLRTSRST